MKKNSKNLIDTQIIAKEILESAYAKKEGRMKAVVVGLSGDLGVGKTAITQAIGKILKIKENITSPTFVIMKSYQLSDNIFNKLIHIDAYRLDDENELLKLGWADILADSANLIMIEWPENVSKILPKEHLKINICHTGGDCREIEIV